MLPTTRTAARRAGAATALVGAGLAWIAPAADAAPTLPIVPAPACSDQAGCAADRAVEDIAMGRGDAAATVIRETGYAHDAATLGDIIYRAGVEATGPGADDSDYSHAVATAFTHGGVPLAVATDAFRVAGSDVAGGGLTPERAKVGSAAIAETYAAYTV